MATDVEKRLRNLEYRLWWSGYELDVLEDRAGLLVQEAAQFKNVFQGAGCATICVHVTNSGTGADIAGALMEIKQSGTLINQGFSDGAGMACASVPASGTYDVIVSKTGCTTNTQSTSVTCGTNVSLTASLPCGTCGSTTTLRVFIQGCVALVGASVTATGPGGFSYSGTTNASGFVDIDITSGGAGVYTYSGDLVGSRYSPGSATVTMVCGTNQTKTLNLTHPGYTCPGDQVVCKIPIANVLHTNSLGDFTYNGGTPGTAGAHWDNAANTWHISNDSAMFTLTGGGVLHVLNTLISDRCPPGLFLSYDSGTYTVTE